MARAAPAVTTGLIAVAVMGVLGGCATARSPDPSGPTATAPSAPSAEPVPATVEPASAEALIVEFVQRETGVVVRDVTCPSGMEAKVGVTFDCTFDGPDGAYVAHMRITAVDVPRVDYRIDTDRIR